MTDFSHLALDLICVKQEVSIGNFTINVLFVMTIWFAGSSPDTAHLFCRIWAMPKLLSGLASITFDMELTHFTVEVKHLKVMQNNEPCL